MDAKKQERIDKVEALGAAYCHHRAPHTWARTILESLERDGEDVTEDTVIAELEVRGWYVNADDTEE